MQLKRQNLSDVYVFNVTSDKIAFVEISLHLKEAKEMPSE